MHVSYRVPFTTKSGETIELIIAQGKFSKSYSRLASFTSKRGFITFHILTISSNRKKFSFDDVSQVVRQCILAVRSRDTHPVDNVNVQLLEVA